MLVRPAGARIHVSVPVPGGQAVRGQQLTTADGPCRTFPAHLWGQQSACRTAALGIKFKGSYAERAVATANRKHHRPFGMARASELAAAARVEDDLGHVVHAQPQLLGYLIRPQTLLVVQQCQLLLRSTPRLTDHPGGGGRLPRLDAVARNPL